MVLIVERGPASSGYVAKNRITSATKNVLERLAYSYAFGQSVKQLSVFEKVGGSSTETSKAMPEKMANHSARSIRAEVLRQSAFRYPGHIPGSELRNKAKTDGVRYVSRQLLGNELWQRCRKLES